MFGCYALSGKLMSTTVYRQVAKLLKFAEPRRVQGISCIDFAINYETVEKAFSLLSMHILFKERERERLYFVSILPEKETKGCVSVTKCVCPWHVRNLQSS